MDQKKLNHSSEYLSHVRLKHIYEAEPGFSLEIKK